MQQQMEASHWQTLRQTLRRLEGVENDLRALYNARFGPRAESGGE